MPAPGTVLTRDHRGLANSRVSGRHRLDLARLDPEAPDLHLVVGAAREHQLPAGRPSDQVPRPVHPLARLERARHEPLARQPREPQIPPGQPGSGHVQLAHHARRNGPQGVIHHVHTGVGDRGADRHRAAATDSGSHRHTAAFTVVSLGP
nr:hypothetical protein [Actinomadura madurae]